MSKDYSLLRPFDLEKAKQGEPICWYLNSGLVRFIGITLKQEVVYENQDGFLCYATSNKIKMAPLCWLEDKPVYEGDILYRKLPGTNEIQELTAQCIEETYGDVFIQFGLCNAEYADNRRQCLYWTKPKQKKQGWINVYPDDNQHIGLNTYTTKAFADLYANKITRIACVPFEYEID